MREPLPTATVIHATAGRTRLRVGSRRGEPEYFARCADRLANIAGVLAVNARAMTGSLLVHHDVDAFDAVAEAAERAGLFVLVEIETPAAPAPTLPPAPALGALAFASLGVVQLLQKRVLPPALTLFWYAATLARDLRQPDAGEE